MSKGRKLSYEVQKPLQNFMFPVLPERPVILTELFSSVFGKSTRPAAPSVALAPANGHRSPAQEAVPLVHTNLFMTS